MPDYLSANAEKQRDVGMKSGKYIKNLSDTQGKNKVRAVSVSLKHSAYRPISRLMSALLSIMMLLSMASFAAAGDEITAEPTGITVIGDEASANKNGDDEGIISDSIGTDGSEAELPADAAFFVLRKDDDDAAASEIDVSPDAKQEGGESWSFDDETNTYTVFGDVTVVGENNEGRALTFDILEGGTVTWTAYYTGESRGDEYVLVDVKGSGTYEIAEDGIISLDGAGTVIRTKKDVMFAVGGYGSVTANGYGSLCTAIDAGGSVLLADCAYIGAYSDIGCTAINVGGNIVMTDDSTVNASGYCSMGIRSETDIKIELAGNSYIYCDSGGVFAKNANVTLSEYAAVSIQGALAFVDGELYGNAITAKNVSVQDGAMVSALNGAAVFYSGELNVSGGLLVAYGDGIGGATLSIEDAKESEPPHMLNVIFKNGGPDIKTGGTYTDMSNPELVFRGDALAVAWDYVSWLSSGKPRYRENDAADLFVYPAKGAEFGWSAYTPLFWYSYGENSNETWFSEFDEDRILLPNRPGPKPGDDPEYIDLSPGADAEGGRNWSFDEKTNTYTIYGDVIVEGQNYYGDALIFNILDGGIVIWTATYYGASGGDYGLISVAGDGTFEVSGDAEISLASAGIALGTGKDIELILSGGSSIEVYDWRGYCIAVKAEGNVLITEEAHITAVGAGGSAGICVGGDVTVTGEGYISAGIGIFSEYGIQIEVSGSSTIYGDDGAVFAKEASVSVSENAQISVRTPLSYKDGELYGNAVTAKNVIIRDSAMVRALNGAAVFYTGKLDISGGLVAAYGDGIGGAVFSVDDLDGAELPHLLNVIYKFGYGSVKDGYEYADISEPESVFSGEGTALAWNYITYYNAEIPRKYSKDDKTDLIVYPAESTDYGWDDVDMHFWVTCGKSDYTFNFMTFVSDRPLKPNRPVPDPGGEPVAPNEIDIRKLTDSASGEGWEFDGETDTYTVTSDVTVVGENGNGRSLIFNILDGGTVTWMAGYRGKSKGDEFILVDVTGSGSFVVDGGEITLAGPGVAVKAERGVALEVTNGGNVSIFSEDETDVCTAIKSGGSVLLADGASVEANSMAFGTAICAGGDVTIENSSVAAGGDFSAAIRSDSDISITIMGETCQVQGYGGAVSAKEATVTAGGYAVVRARGALKFCDGELYGNAIMAKNISVRDFAHVTALNGAAVLYSGLLDVSGGLVAAYGDGIGGAVFSINSDGAPEVYHMLNVIFKAENLTFKAGGEYRDISKPEACIVGDAIALAWDFSAWYSANKPIYYQDEKTDIISYPEDAGFGWDTRAPGFWYSRGENSGMAEFGITDIDKPLRPNPKRDPSINPDDRTKPGENANPGSNNNPDDNTNPGDGADQSGETKPDTSEAPPESPDPGGNTGADGNTVPAGGTTDPSGADSKEIESAQNKTPSDTQDVLEIAPEVPPLSQTHTQEHNTPEGIDPLPVAVGIAAIALAVAAVFWRKKPKRRA